MAEAWLWCLAGIFACVILILSGKICLMKKAADEIREGLAEILKTESNTLLTVSARDKHMRRLAQDLNVELARLAAQRHLYEQGDLELRESVANLSHDIRTPLTAVCGYLELLREQAGKSGESVGRYLGIIENRVAVLKNLTDELFQYSIVMSTDNGDFEKEIENSGAEKNEAGREKNKNGNLSEPVVLNHILEESLSAYYAVFRARQIEPQIRMPERPVVCPARKNAVSRIFENIINNALKYSEGDLQVTLSEDGEVVFSNHAPGLDEVQAGRLFDRFYTVDTARKSTGLGLSIAKALTERMGGVIFAGYHDGILSVHVRFNKLSQD